MVLRRAPKRRSVTIVLGLIADVVQPANMIDPATGTILLCADTMASYVNPSGAIVASHGGLGKIYPLPHDFYAAFSDDYSWSHKVASELHNEMLKLDFTSDGIRDLVQLAMVKAFDYAFLWYRGGVCKDLGITEDEYLHDVNLDPRLKQAAQDELSTARADIPAELIVAGQTHRGPVLFKGNGTDVQEATDFVASGSAVESATNWFKVRGQNCHMSTQRSFYHMREAKTFAETDKYVGENAQYVIFPVGGEPKLMKERGDLMGRWQDEFGMRHTDLLDNPDRRQSFKTAFGIDGI